MQTFVVFLLVCAAALFAAWRLAGASARLRVLNWAVRRLRVASARHPALARLRLRMEAAASTQATACAACGSRSAGSRKPRRG